MLAPLAIVALLIGGSQAAMVVAEQDVGSTAQQPVVEVQTVERSAFVGE
jgi:hypothetical protein